MECFAVEVALSKIFEARTAHIPQNPAP